MWGHKNFTQLLKLRGPEGYGSFLGTVPVIIYGNIYGNICGLWEYLWSIWGNLITTSLFNRALESWWLIREIEIIPFYFFREIQIHEILYPDPFVMIIFHCEPSVNGHPQFMETPSHGSEGFEHVETIITAPVAAPHVWILVFWVHLKRPDPPRSRLGNSHFSIWNGTKKL